MKNKKGQVVNGLNIAGAFVIGILVVALIGFLVIIVIGSMGTTAGEKDTSSNNDFVNGTTSAVMNESITSANPATISNVNSALDGCSVDTVYIVVTNNASAVKTVPSTNYTITGCKIYANTGLGITVNNTQWNVTGLYSYKKFNSIYSIKRNATNGVASVFSNSVTWFALLGIAILILIITFIIAIVIRIRGGGSEERMEAV